MTTHFVHHMLFNPCKNSGDTTYAPATSAPPTNCSEKCDKCSKTFAPATFAPPTVAPPTFAPATIAPPIIAPATFAPPTIAPATDAPKIRHLLRR